MDSREFSEWMAFNAISPISQERGDLHAAMICSTLANCNSRKRFSVEDFMPDFGPKQRQSIEEMQARIQMAIGSAHGINS